MTAAHSVCDGRSLFALFCDLLDEYEAWRWAKTRAPAPVGTIPLPLEALFPEWLTGDQLQAAIDDFVVRARPRRRAIHRAVPSRRRRGGTSDVARAVLQRSGCRDHHNFFDSWARQHGTSVTGAVAAAEMQALARAQPAACRSLDRLGGDDRPSSSPASRGSARQHGRLPGKHLTHGTRMWTRWTRGR